MTADPLRGAAGMRAALNARVEKIFDHAADTRSLFLSLTSGKHLRFIPGQFISITIPLGDETRSRPYSVASDAEDPFDLRGAGSRAYPVRRGTRRARADRAGFFVRDRYRACRRNLRSAARVGAGAMGHRRRRSHAPLLYLRGRQGRYSIARPAARRRL